jgi:hypothetical protein
MMTLADFDVIVKRAYSQICGREASDSLEDNLIVIRNAVADAAHVGSLFKISGYLDLVQTLLNAVGKSSPGCDRDRVAVLVARHIGHNMEYVRDTGKHLGPMAQDQLAEIVAADPHQKLNLKFCTMLGHVALWSGPQAFALLFDRFLDLFETYPSAQSEEPAHLERVQKCVGAMNKHFSRQSDAEPLLAVLRARHTLFTAALQKMRDTNRLVVGVEMYVTLKQQGFLDLAQLCGKPEMQGDDYNYYLLMGSLGEAPAAEEFNGWLVEYPERLTVPHLCYAIQNPALDLPLAQLKASGIAFDVLKNWISRVHTLQLPGEHCRQRLVEVMQTLVDCKSGLKEDLVKSRINKEWLLEVEGLCEGVLMRDLGM